MLRTHTPLAVSTLSRAAPISRKGCKDDNDDDEASIASDLDEKLELDYQIGEDLKERVIPRAVDWFSGRALLHERGAFGGDESDDYDDEFDEEDEDDRCVSPAERSFPFLSCRSRSRAPLFSCDA